LKTHPELCLLDVSQLFLPRDAGGVASHLVELARAHYFLHFQGYGNDRVKHFIKSFFAFGTWALRRPESWT